MPLLHCKNCDHEWEGRITSMCAWCGEKGYILEEKTPLEKLIETGVKFIMDKKFGGE